MKTICITGIGLADLQGVSEIMLQAGMKAAKPTKPDDTIDMGYWHEQVLSLVEDDSETNALEQPGKFWEQLASDIFLANIKSPVWGWADPRSTWLLDFWLNFEPKIYFILVCVSPQQMLANFIAESSTEASVSDVISTWQAHQQEILRFHHRNPHRSLLVSATDCFENPGILISTCVKRWQLPLKDINTDAGDQVRFVDPLADYLAERLCEIDPQALSLQQELEATVFQLGSSNRAATATLGSSQEVIAAYRQLNDRSGELQQLQAARDECDALHVDVAALTQTREEQSNLATERQTRIDTLTQERDSHAQQVAEGQAQIDTLKAAQSKLTESEQENELLLLQLHQVQEELEHYFLQHQETQRSLEKAESRWQRMLHRSPAYCDYQSIEIVAGESTSGNNIKWRLSDLNAAGRNLPNLEFHTLLEDGTAGFLLNRKPDTPAPLLRWPTAAANQSQLTLIPVGTHANVQQRVECLLDIATSDWDLLQTLSRVLTEALAEPATLKAPADFNPTDLRTGLEKLTEILQNFPATIRYDQVTLKREQVNPDYEHLWLKFDNLAFGSQSWPLFEFRLSCANVRPNWFGNNPKLEFPEEVSQAPFQNWFIESYDDFGAKLELRFALPESMDMVVWQRLSDHDRAFISVLISRLPAIFATLQATGVKLKRSWEDWHKVAKDVQGVIALRTAPPNLPDPQTELAMTLPASSTMSRIAKKIQKAK